MNYKFWKWLQIYKAKNNKIILADTMARYEMLKDPVKNLAVILNDNIGENEKALRLAATDIFVEKAQFHLTNRAYFNYFVGFLMLVGTASISWFFLLWASGSIQKTTTLDLMGTFFTGPLILKVLGKLAVSSVYLSGIYLTASFGRAFLHEGTILFSRRHSLRFGRLFVYLSDGKMTSDDLFKAFGWNISPSTAFSKVRPELVTKGVVSQLGDALEKTTKAVSNLAQKPK